MASRRSRPFMVTVEMLLISASLGLILTGIYGREAFLIELAAGFLAALAAFMIALAWERDREERQLARAEADLAERRRTEVRRRLPTVIAELERNRKSLLILHEGIDASLPMNPHLLEGAWNASAPSLTVLLADYELTADLAVLYGRIEELRWRLRARITGTSEVFDDMTLALVGELIPEVETLLGQLKEQSRNPNVKATGLRHRAQVSDRVVISDSVTAEVTRRQVEPGDD